MRVMTWNILLGGGDEARFAAVLDVLRGARPDVLVLQECLGWEDGRRLGRVAEVLGLPANAAHVTLCPSNPRGSGRRYHLAALSRPPFLQPPVHHAPPVLAHSAVQVQIEHDGAPLTLLGTHLVASSEEERVAEARWLLGVDVGPRALLLGDLNALSPRDPYPADLAQRVLQAGVDKFGHPPRMHTIGLVEAAGWVDTLHLAGPPERWVTAHRERGGVPIDYRTDYVFAGPGVSVRRAEIVEVGEASDHQAVVVTLGVASSAAVDLGRG